VFVISEKSGNETDLESNSSDKNDPSGLGWLSESSIHRIYKNLQDVVVPQGTTQIPKGIGTKANGKLKASEWHALFATHLPLAAFDVFIGD
ncbi:hypothetical protein CROQUDRAFT_26295, partial [Cronartium quercuum f. sp. fusiforme G11]